ncbi:MAG: hypothetical protein M1819_005618 [Sarea resinae]|nr:MAG: hypothetical protein M1819_005618 [Sarea resinae]
MAAATVDVPFLSSYCSVPETTLSALIDAPTTELVKSFLESVASKAREHEELRSEKLRTDVELENAVRSGETKNRALKSTVDKSLKEVSDVRGKLKEQENARSALESELQNLKSSASTSTSEVEALKSRISSLESSNRDTLSLLESKSTAYDRLADELSSEHQKTIELRRELSNLEQSLQTASSSSTTSKFREQSLQQEIELLKKNNEWFESELKTKSAEYLKYRKEKGARIAELQRLNEESNSSVESLKRTETTLRKRLEEVGQKADDAFAKIQRLQEEAARSEEGFKVELDSANRLAELQKNAATTARERMQELQNALEQAKEDAADEIGKIRAEAETERSEKEAAEQRIIELEVQIERLEADVSNLQTAASLPGTPRRSVNGDGASTPTRFGASAFSPGASKIKGGLNFTQMYTEYSNAKAELDMERRRNEKLSATIDEMIQDLELKQPEIEELHAEHDQLQGEVAELSSYLDEVGKERDEAKKESRRWEGQVEGLTREGDILRQQLRDLSAQIKLLLLEVHSHDEGFTALSAAEQMQLERIARGEADEDALEGMTDTDRFISQRLTVFRNIRELQDQNVQLLRVTRELGEKMEAEESRAKQTAEAGMGEREELETLRSRVERYKDEMKSMVTQSQSYIRERDMFRRMLSHRGQIPPNSDLASMFGQSIDGGAPPATPPNGLLHSAESPSAKDLGDYAKLLKDLQSHFDAYRQEAATDLRALKDQIDKLAKDKSELQADSARYSSQVTLARERYDMLQANFSMLQSENSELQKRSQVLAESAAKQDLKTQQVAEELVEARGLAESMRNETANLKAEKDLWKKIEKRLNEDNEALLNEKSRLNGLNTNLQNLLNERELSSSETRRRLQERVDALASELQATKRKLNDEVEDGKKAALRREYEANQNRQRIDDLVASLGSIREELVAAKTTRDHLQARVDEMTIELRSAEERVQVLQPRPTPRSTSNAENTDQPEEDQEDALRREQELAMEVSELKRDLELAKGEFENAQAAVEQYKAISQSSEEELQSLNETQDQYRAEMDRLLEEKDSKIRDLEQRVEDITAELSNSNTELNTLRSEQAEQARKVEEQHAQFEADLARVKDESERNAAAAQFHQEDLKAQAEIAQRAQQNYENELVKHAEAAKALQKVRGEYNELKTEVVALRTDAEAARATLSQSEESWAETRSHYERELSELKTRREDINAQNKLLHQQLESVTSQISALQQNRASLGENEESNVTPGSELENIQEVIKYLRREKEIVDVQYELSVQESKRLRQQLDHTRSQLDETRLKLDQERRAQMDQETNSMSHSKLMDTINELNLFRESSITLRNEARVAQAQLAEKSKQAAELFQQIEPLRTKVRELENEKETQVGEFKLLQEDRDHWQQRTQNILQKYDRVDPAELEALKEKITSLQTERDELLASRQPLQEEVNSIQEKIQQVQEEATNAANRWSAQKESFIRQAKAKAREQTGQLNAKAAECDAALAAKEQLEKDIVELRTELEATKAARDEATSHAVPSSQQPRHASVEDVAEEGQIDEAVAGLPEERKELEGRVEAAEHKANEESARAEEMRGQAASLQARVDELEQRISELEQNLEDANLQISHLNSQAQKQAQASEEAIPSDQLEKLQEDLVNAQQEVETLKANASISASIADAQTENGSKPVAEQIAEQVETMKAELKADYDARVHRAEEQFKQRADRMKTQLSKKLTEGKDQIRETLTTEHGDTIAKMTAEHQEEIERLRTQHTEELERLRVQHTEDLERLKQEEESRFEQLKQSQQDQKVKSQDGSEAPAADMKADQADKAPKVWSPSESEVKDLVANNPTVKQMVVRNLQAKLQQEKESLIAKAREEQKAAMEQELAKSKEEQEILSEKKLEEARNKAETMRAQAVAMEGKRSSVKISMAETKARNALFKVEIVEKAAIETPQRAVVEVWAIAKDARPPPAVVAPNQAANAAHQGSANGAPSFGKPSAAPAVQRGVFGQPTPGPQQHFPSPQQAAAPMQGTQAQAPRPLTPGQASAQPQQKQDVPPSASPAQTQLPQALPNSPAQPQPQMQQAQQPQTSSGLPAKPPQGHNAGTGPTALRGLMQQQSGIPRVGAPAGRGRGGRGGGPQGQNQNQAQQQPSQLPQGQRGGHQSGLPRGGRGGRGGGQPGRGGQQGIQTSGMHPNQSPQQSSPRGSLNAGARQFVPGQGSKRPREDGSDAVDGASAGKRARGGGAGN